MDQRPKAGFKGVILVWVLGLALGVAAGAATAMLLMPGSEAEANGTIAERMRTP